MGYKFLQYVFYLMLLLLWCNKVSANTNMAYECLIEPMQTVEVGSPVVGVIKRVHVRRGDKVEKGQVIATLEASVERAAAELAKYKSEMIGPIATAEAKLEFAKRKFERRRDMHANDFMSAQESDDAEGEMKFAEAELTLARENKRLSYLEWQQQSSQLDLRTIYSPLTGVVMEQGLYPGEIAEPGNQKEPILKLAQLDPLRVHVILPLAVFRKIKLGMAAEVTPESPIVGRYVGRVKVVDRLVDAASGTFSVFFEIPNPNNEVPAGVKCKAEFPVSMDGVKR